MVGKEKVEFIVFVLYLPKIMLLSDRFSKISMIGLNEWSYLRAGDKRLETFIFLALLGLTPLQLGHWYW